MRHYLKPIATAFVAAGVFATPAAAQESIEEPNGYAITDVNLRAGPSTDYPVLVTVPEDAPIAILGCLEDYSWCDTVFEGYRGWMAAIYLAGLYEGDYFLLRDYAPDLGYQQVTFEINAYWDAYYQDQPFYAERARWIDPGPEGPGEVDEAVFYDKLSPHGSWTWTQGRYVWVPTGVDSGWRPYTRGRWVYTNRGWTWVSDEPFGWATYHYGRWGFSNRIGWFWVPGTRWAPAWVSWRQSDDYLAWAPLPPTYDRGPRISINISIGSVPDYYWSVVPSRRFLSPNLGRYYVNDYRRRRPALQRARYVGHTKIVNNTTIVNNVVNVNYVQQQTNQRIVTRRIENTGTAVNGRRLRANALQVYRPVQRGRRGRLGPAAPQQFDQVARLSRTAAQGQGAAATDDLLTPPDVRKAVKRGKGGKKRKAWKDGAPKASPSARRANMRPVPAQGLGPSKAALDKDRRKGHAGKKGKKPKQANARQKAFPADTQNGVSPGKRRKDAQPGVNTSRGIGPADTKPDGKPRKSLGEPGSKPEHKAKPNKKQNPAQAKRKRPDGKKNASSKNGTPNGKNVPAKDEPEVKPNKKKGPAQAKRKRPDGKKNASSKNGKPNANGKKASVDDQPTAKPARRKHDQKQGPAQVKQETPNGPGKKAARNGKPKAKKTSSDTPPVATQGQPKPKAKPKKRNTRKDPAQANQRKPGAAGKKASSKNDKPKAKSTSSNNAPVATQAQPKPKAKPKKRNKQKQPAQSSQRKPEAAGKKVSNKRKPVAKGPTTQKAAASKKAPPRKKAAAKKKKTPAQAQRKTPRPAAKNAAAKRKPAQASKPTLKAAAKKAAPKRKAASKNKKKKASAQARRKAPRPATLGTPAKRKPVAKKAPPKRKAASKKTPAKKKAAAPAKKKKRVAGKGGKKKKKKKN